PPSVRGVFVSSRRRHTRSPRDWSSDVCSSDLLLARVIADEQGLRQVLRNLCENALRYTPGGGEIVVCTRLEERPPEGAEGGAQRSEERRVGQGWSGSYRPCH